MNDLQAIEAQLEGAMDAEAATVWRYETILALVSEVRQLRAVLALSHPHSPRDRAATLAEKIARSYRVRQIRELSAGLREKAKSPEHVFYLMGSLLSDVAKEYEDLAAEISVLKGNLD